jgi:hypothetical protein
LLNIPGVGPVHVFGPAAADLFDSPEANVTNRPIVSMLAEKGIPEEDANAYVEGIRRGGALVLSTVEDRFADRATDILNRHHPVDIHRVSERWRQSGWTRFNPKGQPIQPNELDWPQSITARPGDIRGQESGENWPHDIVVREDEDDRPLERGESNWPENIADPEQRTDSDWLDDEGADWPHNLTE